jgi:hypothetical protein
MDSLMKEEGMVVPSFFELISSKLPRFIGKALILQHKKHNIDEDCKFIRE